MSEVNVMETMETAVVPATTAEVQYVDRTVEVPDPKAYRKGFSKGGIIGAAAGTAIGSLVTVGITKVIAKVKASDAEKKAKQDEAKALEDAIKLAEANGCTVNRPAPRTEPAPAAEQTNKA